MNQLRQYGITVITLSDLVDNFCLEQGNYRESMLTKQLVHAKWVWKDLFRRTIWRVTTTVLDVDCHNGTIRLPTDCENLINISVIDCHNKIHSLGYNPAINTAEILCQKNKCSCSKCGGNNSLCSVVDNLSMTTSTVLVQGVPYTMRTWTTIDGNGDVFTASDVPTWDTSLNSGAGGVVIIKRTNFLTNLEVTDKGCIKPVQANVDKLTAFCGCGQILANGWEGGRFNFAYANDRETIPTVYNYYGQWNYNAASREIVHIFGNHRVQNHEHWDADMPEQFRGIKNVIVQYLTNGETYGQEILVPEYALDAMQTGIMARQMMYNPRSPMNEKVGMKAEYEAQKIKLTKYFNPVHLDEMAKLQTLPVRW